MLIDPFVVIAQIINFLILVALLKHFLYKPITQAMLARSQRIERQLAAAASKEQDADVEKGLYLQKQQELEAQKKQWLEQARQEVEQEKIKLRQEAETEVNVLQEQWHENMICDRHKFAVQTRDRLTKQVTFTARKALTDLAKASLEDEIVETFIDRLYHLDSLQTEIIDSTAILDPQHIVSIRSSFKISSEKKERLTTAIKEQISAKAEVQFETKDDFICGIELRDRGYKISWNLEHYLTELETETSKVLAENTIAI
ncbi:ATP F0F1 synthase subunit beta [Waterburya agarophytonicola K14]|uniref:ATP synthase subunit b n=1 Tax=Waterburya agarophytonicola KI4 TaxID=2874699 RepID=A0A964FHR2_9CYAN|nr:ATP F0F1 synthase subunit beta [Waterburya agarophytonicola]MCC0179277.1 ATP F0F1 synthase subunit beta [Waterburya agarophytonicola KI4]